ncbi:OmpH family outer membrane protein [Porticoccus sp. W117]|uniref:OmpH family outer membrane protein n=1 Tax=Porticoccus sp. W117 TaxID=3054777 RepID=UPI0025934DDF|nr:OmpH family outer membrane protein [Porticoccus sp. W117]MDM3870271.1 OmpH family outer membrane protein [Porticoccus sp. W117]
MGKLKTTLFALIAAFSLTAVAETKIAVVDMERAIVSSEMWKQHSEAAVADSNLAKLAAERDGLVADAQKLQKDFETNNLSWDDAKKAKANREMESFRADLQLLERKIQAEQRVVQQTTLQAIQPVAFEQLQALIDEEKVELLLKKDAVWSNGAGLDITNKLIDRINKSAADK